MNNWNNIENSQNDTEEENLDKIRLDRIIKNSETSDVTYDLFRYFWQRMQDKDQELLKIQRNGFIGETISWLKSTTEKGMKYGTASKEERILKAREFAEKAGVLIEDLAQQENIDIT